MSLEEDRIFEEQLRQIKPRRLDPGVVQRIAAAINTAERKPVQHNWKAYLGWGGLIAAASVMIVVGLSLFNGVMQVGQETAAVAIEPQPMNIADNLSGKSSFEPVLAQNNLKDRVDEGIVFLGNGLTARKYRYEFIDRVVWRNPSNGAVVEMEVPRDEVVLIPVQTY